MNIMNKRTRGAVSVFLVMILVPCIVVTSVFVDLGRVHMSKSMAESASDLALNSLLTNYDSDLNEWYGMVASCQSIDEFYEKSAKFFLRTLSSQGLSDDEIYLLSDYYANATNDDTIYDLLQVECQSETGSMITAVSGANLSNSTLIKEQVVEFMKYRAPIELTTSIIDRLNSDDTVLAAIDSEKNEPLVENKTNYYKAEGELLAAAFNSYIAIYDYYKEATTNNLTNEQLQNYANSLTTYKNAYSEIHKLMIANLYNTSGLSIYHRRVYELNSYNTTYTKTSSEVYSRKETIDGADHYYIDGTKITTLLTTLEEEIQDFKDAKSNFETAASNLMGKLPGNSENSSNYVQWWVQMNKAVNASSGTNHTTNFSRAAEDMLKAYSKVLAIKECELGEEIPSDWEDKFNELTSEVSELQGKYLKANQPDNGDAYLKTVKKLEEVSSANIYNISSANLSISVDGQTLTIDQAIPYIKSQLSTIRSELRSYIRLLNIAIDGNEDDEDVPEGDRVKSLDQLLTLANNYKTKLTAWKNSAETTNTSKDNEMADEDLAEINGIQQVCQELDEESVRELKTRLTNIRSQIQTVIDGIDDMKYGNKSVKSIDSYSTFRSEADTKVQSSGIKLKNSELSSYASNTFSQLFKPNAEKVCELGHLSDANYNMTISPESKQVQTPELFVYLHDQFKGASKQAVQEKQDELDGGEAEGESAANAAKNKNRYSGGGSEITKEYSGDKTFNIAEGAVSGVLDLFDSLINLDITNIRDDLYVTAYIMNMFSYATYENEGMYGLIDDKTSLTLANYLTKYGAVKGNSDTEPGKWLSADLKDSYNKSLTNKLINKGNNAAYCAEVEYILYGGRADKGNAENVKSVYNNIYGLRYALNLISGFQHFWNGSNSTALAISGIAYGIWFATGGIIPEPLTKVVLIPILTIFETSKDLDRLEAGFPVELYKAKDENWWLSVPDVTESVGDFTSALKSGLGKNNTDKGIFYSDYLTVFVYLGLKSSAQDDMLQRMAEVIQTNIGKKIGENSGYSLSKSQVYFNLKATIRVKPLMITLPFFDDYSNNMQTETDWCTYTVNTTRGY